MTRLIISLRWVISLCVNDISIKLTEKQPANHQPIPAPQGRKRKNQPPTASVSWSPGTERAFPPRAGGFQGAAGLWAVVPSYPWAKCFRRTCSPHAERLLRLSDRAHLPLLPVPGV